MSKRDSDLSPIDLIEEGQEWQVWKHTDTSGRVIFSRVIIIFKNEAIHLYVIAQDEEVASDPGGYVRALAEGMGLIGKDWFLELYGSRPLGLWCAEGKDLKNIFRLE